MSLGLGHVPSRVSRICVVCNDRPPVAGDVSCEKCLRDIEAFFAGADDHRNGLEDADYLATLEGGDRAAA